MPDLLTEHQVAERLQVSVRTARAWLRRMRVAPVQVSKRLPRYRLEDIQDAERAAVETERKRHGWGRAPRPRRVPAVDDSTAPLGERLERATLQLTQYLGRTSGEVAEASSPESAGGMEITAEEGRQITELLDELIGLATEMRGRVQEETSPYH